MPLFEEDDDTPEYDPCDGCGTTSGDCSCHACGSCDTIFRITVVFCGRCDSCPDCCRCFACEGCNALRYGGDQCSACERCVNGCCSCRYCNYCGSTQREVCEGCGYCMEYPGVCGCRCEQQREEREAARLRANAPREIEIREMFIKNDLKFFDGKPNKLNPSKRYISAEIEVSEMPSNRRGVKDIVQKWLGQIVYDGSVSAGFEINTSPASGDQYNKQIEEICEQLTKGTARITKSCGLHVHVDARDFTYFDIRRLILLYAKIEKALYRVVAPSRRDNHYCAPCGEKFSTAVKKSSMPKEFKKNLFRSVYNKGPGIQFNKKMGDPAEKYARNCAGARYSALNIHSWFYRGTIECRMHHGTITPKAIRSWGVLWARLLDVALTLSERQIEALPDDGLKAILEVTKGMPETHTWVINRTLFFAKQEGFTGTMKVPGSVLTCNEIRALRQPDQTLDDTKEDNQ